MDDEGTAIGRGPLSMIVVVMPWKNEDALRLLAGKKKKNAPRGGGACLLRGVALGASRRCLQC